MVVVAVVVVVVVVVVVHSCCYLFIGCSTMLEIVIDSRLHS